MRITHINRIPENIFDQLGFYWYKSPDNQRYVADELVAITQREGDACYQAAEQIYDMFIAAGQHVIDHKLYPLLDIPESLIELIELTWEDESHFHIIGRFDFAGGLDGRPIKLIEFNSDTPSMIFETALVQWMLLRHNRIDEERQFNNLYETIKASFVRMKALHPVFGLDEHSIPHALFSCFDLGLEDENTTRLMEEIAYESGFITGFEFIDKVRFSKEGIIANQNDEPFDYWYKYIPYELIGTEEPELAHILTDIVKTGKVRLINPPYVLLFQSKGIMKLIWDLFTGHPLLLETQFEPLHGRPFVEKKTLSREGANVRIYDRNRRLLDQTEGEYERYRSVFQELADLPKDESDRYYQMGVFFSYEPCGLGFRREKGIINNNSQFVGHYIEAT